MSDEQRLILKMLEEGKISAAEAEALLNALGQPEALEEEERSADVWEKVEKQGRFCEEGGVRCRTLRPQHGRRWSLA